MLRKTLRDEMDALYEELITKNTRIQKLEAELRQANADAKDAAVIADQAIRRVVLLEPILGHASAYNNRVVHSNVNAHKYLAPSLEALRKSVREFYNTFRDEKHRFTANDYLPTKQGDL